jgi:hypothetical protein
MISDAAHEQLEQLTGHFSSASEAACDWYTRRTNGEVPCFVPAEVCLVQQDSHQLGHGERRVRIVELNGDMIGQLGPTDVAFAKAREVSCNEQLTRSILEEPQARRLGGIVGYSTRVSNSARRC